MDPPEDLRAPRYFLAVAESSTSATLLRASTSLSRAIRDLEVTLGTELFVRTNRSVRLTDALVPAVVRAYRSAFPGVSLELEELLERAQLDRLEAGSIDTGILRSTRERADLRFETLLEDPVCGALPRRHPLASRRPLGDADLAE